MLRIRSACHTPLLRPPPRPPSLLAIFEMRLSRSVFLVRPILRFSRCASRLVLILAVPEAKGAAADGSAARTVRIPRERRWTGVVRWTDSTLGYCFRPFYFLISAIYIFLSLLFFARSCFYLGDFIRIGYYSARRARKLNSYGLSGFSGRLR